MEESLKYYAQLFCLSLAFDHSSNLLAIHCAGSDSYGNFNIFLGISKIGEKRKERKTMSFVILHNLRLETFLLLLLIINISLAIFRNNIGELYTNFCRQFQSTIQHFAINNFISL